METSTDYKEDEQPGAELDSGVPAVASTHGQIMRQLAPGHRYEKGPTTFPT